MKKSVLLILVCLSVLRVSAQEKTRILFVLDGSYSMNKSWSEGTKWQTAVSTLTEITDSISRYPNVEVGMRLFGHQFPEHDNNCKDTKMEIGFGRSNGEKVRTKLAVVKPKGITPLAYSVEKCGGDFSTMTSSKNILVLITDGEEACDGDPCAVAKALQQQGIILKPFIIGMALPQQSQNNLECIGKLLNTTNAGEFAETMKRIVQEAISKTTLQVNLLDSRDEPAETDVNMTFTDAETGIVKYNLYHTLNARGLPDTLVLSPLFTYNITVHTVPPVVIENVMLRKNEHTVVEAKIPQGQLSIAWQNTSGINNQPEVKCLVHGHGEAKTLYVQSMNAREKFICGSYDVDVLTLPRTRIEDLKIEQSNTTDVLLPYPAKVVIAKTFETIGCVFLVTKSGLQKVYDLLPDSKPETIWLQPGKYRVLYRTKRSRQMEEGVEKDFEAISAGNITVTL